MGSTVTTTQQRLDDLKAKKLALDREIELAERKAEEEKQRVGLMWTPNPHQIYHRIFQDFGGDFKETSSQGVHRNIAPLFRTQAQAQNFAFAFQVMLEMRAQPGVVAPTPEQTSYVITPQRDGTVQILNSRCKDAIPSTIFARFDTRENASRAVARVGARSLVNAAKTLAFFQ